MPYRLLVLLTALSPFSCIGERPLKQEKILVITRHGIRVPYPPIDNLSWDVYSLDDQRDWFSNFPDWGADMVAGLTAHGQEVLRAMGAFFRETLLNGSQGGGFTIYSAVDNTKRDIKTAMSFFQGAFPDAEVTEKDMFGPGTPEELQYVKTLLNQGDFNAGPACPGSASIKDVIAGETGGDFAALSAEQRHNIRQVNEALKCCRPELCTSQGNSSFGAQCTLMSLPTNWEGQKFYWEDFTGPLSIAGKLMEYLQLLYLNGMAYQKVVPTMNEETLASLMRLHEESMGIPADYWNSRNAASELLVHMAATMQQAVGGQEIVGLHSRSSDALVYYAAHDINIYLIRRLLRLNWLTESFNPNQSPPGGMLLFILYSTGNGQAKKHFVKAFFMSQSMRQQRDASVLTAADPASRVFAVIPGCADGPELSCPFEDFKSLVLKEIKRECVQLVDPVVLEAPSDTSCKQSLEWWMFFPACLGSLLVGACLSSLTRKTCFQHRPAVRNEMATSLQQAAAGA